MTNAAQNFIDCLIDANNLLEGYPSSGFSAIDRQENQLALKNLDLTSFGEWSNFNELEAPQKQPVRIIQHLSCTGGTLLAKCIAAMPNVALLSEANPLSKLHLNSNPRFSPTDLTYLAAHGRFPLIEELSKKLFKADMDVLTKHLKELGKYLVIREHSHSDFLVGDSPNGFSTVRKLLKDDYPVLSVLTVRHPVDSYLSLIENGWIHFSPPTFDEYCKRYLLFTDLNDDIPMCKYEDFVSDPEKEIKLLCEALDLPFNVDFQDAFDLNIMSGDSGRSSDRIGKRKRRVYDDKFREETKQSDMYLRLCKQLDYVPTVANPGGTDNPLTNDPA